MPNSTRPHVDPVEDVIEHVVPADNIELTAPEPPGPHPLIALLPGLGLVCVMALIAWWLGRLAPLIGGPVIGIVFGIIVRNLRAPGAVFHSGIRFAARQVLQWSVVVLGFGLSLGTVVHTGLSSLSVTLVTMSAAFLTAWMLGRLLGVSGNLKTLIGVGTAICGGSAIAAVTPIVRADEHETAFAISTIFLFNLVAVLLFPFLGHLMHLSDFGFGMWAGTAINDTSSVVAAAYSYSHAAGDYATIVKLTRSTLIIPVCLVLAVVEAWRQKRGGAQGFSLMRIFPWFIVWFLVASAARTAGLVPVALQPGLAQLALFMIVMALTSIGLSADLRRMAATGARPILLGTGVWAAVAVSSLLVQRALGQI